MNPKIFYTLLAIFGAVLLSDSISVIIENLFGSNIGIKLALGIALILVGVIK